MVIKMAKKLVYGIGVNDAERAHRGIRGEFIRCAFYDRWYHMMMRCYSDKLHRDSPTYTGCSVAEEWHSFRNFKAWMETQDWQGKELDKDIINRGNKVYSVENCAFVDASVNLFTLDCRKRRGEWPIGVNFNKFRGKFEARCSNPISGKRVNIGYFDCPNEAHLAWKKCKHELACQLADLQSDSRVAGALRVRYL